MGNPVVAQNPSPDKVVAATSEVVRLLLKEGARLSHFQLLIDHPAKRAELIRWLDSGGVIGEQKWTVNEDGTITLTVTSDGTTGPQWIERLKATGKRFSDYAKSLLNSDEFQPTTGVVYNVTILPGSMWTDEERINKKIRLTALNSGLLAPNAELACLLREYLTDKDIEQLGIWWLVVMHEPIEDSGGSPNLLGVNRGDGGQWLRACWGGPGRGWARDDGFVFEVSAS